MMRYFLTLLLSVALFGAAGGTARGQSTSIDSAAIQQLLRGQFERPDAPLAVEPIVIRGNHAVAGWAQGKMGGRVLLRRRHGEWVAVVCAGDPLLKAAMLEKYGVPAVDAAPLAASYDRAEKRLSPGRRQQFSTFVGVVELDKDGHHPGHRPPGPDKDDHHGH